MTDFSKHIMELFQPVDEQNPCGKEDINDEDYRRIRNAFNSRMPITDFAGLKKTAFMVTRSKFKSLFIIVRLIYLWFRVDGLEGYNAGLVLLKEMIDNYKDDVYPKDESERVNSINWLNNAYHLGVFRELDVDKNNASEVDQVHKTLAVLTKMLQQNFNGSKPNLDKLNELVAEKAKDAQKFLVDNKTTKPEPEISTSNGINNNEQTNADEKEPEKVTDNSEQQDQEDTEKEEQGKPILELANYLNEFIEPVEQDNPCGFDVEQQKTQEYKNFISDRLGNYELWLEWSKEILVNQSKSMRVLGFFALANFAKNGIRGLADILVLISKLLITFKEQLHPQDETQKLKTLEYLNNSRFTNLFKALTVGSGDTADLLFLKNACDNLRNSWKTIYESELNLTQIETFISAHKNLLEKPQTSPENERKSAEKKPDDNKKKDVQHKADNPTVNPESVPEFSDNKQAELVIKRALKFFFVEETDSKTVCKIPDSATVIALSRGLKWGRIQHLTHKEYQTELAGPNDTKRGFIKKLYDDGKIEQLVAEVESKFLDNDDENFKLWLDAQYYEYDALIQSDHKYAKIADEICIQLALFINRLPFLPRLIFKNKSTFAGKVTQQWIEEVVIPRIGASKEKDPLNPVILKDYSEIDTYFSQVKQSDKATDAQLTEMEQKIHLESRAKGKFLYRLNMAVFCFEKQRYELARASILKLNEEIKTQNLADWEPELCISTWQTGYVTNLKLMELAENKPIFKERLYEEQLEYSAKISQYDIQRSYQLLERLPKQDELTGA